MGRGNYQYRNFEDQLMLWLIGVLASLGSNVLFSVGIISGNCFRIRSEVNPGHETKWFLLVAFINVFDVGEKHVAWKYFSKSCAVLSLQRMTFMYFCETFCLVSDASIGDFINVILFYLVIGMPHKPLPEQLILPCRIKFSLLKS